MKQSKHEGVDGLKGGTRLALIALAAAAALLGGCGDKGDKATQTAAKVNKEEITVHQIDFLMQRQPPGAVQGEAGQRQMLEHLIDQELSIQKSMDLKLDRDPRVVQQMEAAKRDILARAYAEHVAESVPKPSAEEVARFYADKPALFKERRVYSLQELLIEARPDQYEMLRSHLQGSKGLSEFEDYLRSSGLRFSSNQAVRPAEQLPMDSLETISHMKDGDSAVQMTALGVQLVFLAGSRAEPVDEEKARPAIEAFLLNQRRAQALQADLKALRTGAKIEYLGKFAQPAASAPVVMSPAASATEPGASAALDPNAISKGMGLK